MLARSLCLTFHSPNQRTNPGMGRQKSPARGFFVDCVKLVWLNISMQTIFKHSTKDAFLVAQTMLVLLSAIVIASLDLNAWWNLLLAPFQVMLILSMQNTSLHHHTHWATFNNKKLNHVYELLIAAAAWSTPETYRLSHTIHHKYVNDTPVDGKSKDKISVFGHGKNGQLENAWKFCWRNGFFSWFSPWKYVFYEMWKSQRPNISMMKYDQWHRQYLAIVIFQLLILLVNFSYGVWLIFAIYLLAHFLNYAWHYGEHYGSYHYRGDTTQDSVGIYNRWYNIFCFNSGLHQEHHHRPGVHWTRLHEITKLLPPTRITTNGMHIANVPWLAHLKLLLRH